MLHDANGDSCDALLSAELTFDLLPLQQAYADSYQTDSGAIRMGFDNCAAGVDCQALYQFGCETDPTACQDASAP